MSQRNLQILVLVSVCYVAAQMVADISSLRDVTVFGVTVTALSLAYPLTFTLRDMAQKLAGAQAARTLILASALIYLLTQAFFALIAGMPPAMTEQERATLDSLLTPDARVLFAAVAATVISQLVDTEVYSYWRRRFGSGRDWARVLVSNLISIPLDRLLFLLLAFSFASVDGLLEAFLATTVIRLLISLLTIPGIYLVQEQADTGS